MLPVIYIQQITRNKMCSQIKQTLFADSPVGINKSLTQYVAVENTAVSTSKRNNDEQVQVYNRCTAKSLMCGLIS